MTVNKSFRIGKVRGDLRGQIWYLTYQENGRRQRPRVGPQLKEAKQLAAQVNSQLELGSPSLLSFESLRLEDLQQRWLEHHEHVLRSSLQTINRYRTATEHLLRFVEQANAPHTTSHFRTVHAEQFVRYLRTIEVSPNGHPNSPKRLLLDKGIKYILQCCRSLFNFGGKHRYLSPYAENPFSALDLDRIPVENSKQIKLFSADEERSFLQACDDWQLPIFLTLIMTGLRPGELTHLLLPDDLDLEVGLLRVRNKRQLDWRVKTRNERKIPLVPPLVKILKLMLRGRTSGLVFQRRCYCGASKLSPLLQTEEAMCLELKMRMAEMESESGTVLSRQAQSRLARGVWKDAGLVKTEVIRKEFMRLTHQTRLPELTAPKMLRHLFATTLQEGKVDPLIRCELMGHSVAANQNASHGLGMTANYTQTRMETKRTQLEQALKRRPSWDYSDVVSKGRGS